MKFHEISFQLKFHEISLNEISFHIGYAPVSSRIQVRKGLRSLASRRPSLEEGQNERGALRMARKLFGEPGYGHADGVSRRHVVAMA